jgi:hypothetical protein
MRLSVLVSACVSKIPFTRKGAVVLLLLAPLSFALQIPGSAGTRLVANNASPLAPPWTQLGQLLANDLSTDHFFGHSVAISGNVAVVGAPGYEDFNGHSVFGAAYVFVKSQSGWQNMVQTAKLLPSDGNNCSTCFFGGSVAISGNTIIVGSVTGNAYMYVAPPGGWSNMTETAILSNALAGGDSFGYSVAISENTAVVGAPSSTFGEGSGFIYVKPQSGWKTTSTPDAVLTASDAAGNDLLGSSVAILGNTVLMGAPAKPYPLEYGAAYVFVRPQTGWKNSTENAKLAGAVPRFRALVGYTVAVSSSTAVAGAPSDGAVYEPGEVYVFTAPPSGWANASETALLTNGTNSVDAFGNSVALNGGTILAGASFTTIANRPAQGAVYEFLKPANGWQSTSVFNLRFTEKFGEALDGFGRSVSISGNSVIVGADGRPAGKAAGTSYVFGR